MKIEVLYSPECPHYVAALQLVHEILAETGITAQVELMRVETEEEARRLEFIGSPTVRVDGVLVRGCLMLAVQADGCRVDTIEGVAGTGEIFDLQQAFAEANALQCGFCTPGMLLTAHEILRLNPRADEADIRNALSGNYCRCTGYHAIVEAVRKVGAARSGATR